MTMLNVLYSYFKVLYPAGSTDVPYLVENHKDASLEIKVIAACPSGRVQARVQPRKAPEQHVERIGRRRPSESCP